MQTRMALRYAVGVAIGVAISQGFGWSLSYLVPVLVVMLLASTPTPLSLTAGVQVVVVIAGAMLFGFLATALLLPYPAVAILIIALLMFSVFYMATGGGSVLTSMMLLIALTILPVVGQISLVVVQDVATSLALAGAVAVVVQWLAFAVVPPLPQVVAAAAAQPPAEPPPHEARVRSALRTSAVILPLQFAYLIFGWTSLIVLMIAAILAQQADAKSGATGMVVANLLGGATALVGYNLLVAVPSFTFLVLLMFLLALIFAGRIFTETPTAAIYASAFSAALILIGSSVTPYGDDAGALFYQRLVQVMGGGLYVAAAFYVFPAKVPATA